MGFGGSPGLEVRKSQEFMCVGACKKVMSQISEMNRRAWEAPGDHPGEAKSEDSGAPDVI